MDSFSEEPVAQCDRCRTTENVEYCIDPYQEEINEIVVWVYLCPDCYQEYLWDI